MLTRPVIFVSILFLIAALAYSLWSAFYLSPVYVFAAPPHYCFENDCGGYRDCRNSPNNLQATCCWGEAGADICQTCDVNPETGDFENCSVPAAAGKGLFGSNVLPTPSISPDDGGVVEQPPITTPTAPIAPPSPTEPPTPQTPPTIAPEDSQGNDQSGTDDGITPPKGLLPDTGIGEQPEVQQPEEQPSGEGEGPAGPLT